MLNTEFTVGKSRLATVSALCLLLAMPLAGGDEKTPAGTGEAQLSEQEANAAIDSLKELADGVERWVRHYPSSHLEFDFVLEQCDYETEKIFEWVKGQTRWVPYTGALRGAYGVLMDRRGNSLDRSLLLASLLLEAGFDARLAHSELNRDRSATLLALQTGKSGVHAPGAADSPGQRERAANQAKVADQTRELAKLAGFASASSATDHTEQHLADIADHWWVQVSDGFGWRDLDPMTADGTALASGEQPLTLTPARH